MLSVGLCDQINEVPNKQRKRKREKEKKEEEKKKKERKCFSNSYKERQKKQTYERTKNYNFRSSL
jgi:hypothetical protein